MALFCLCPYHTCIHAHVRSCAHAYSQVLKLCTSIAIMGHSCKTVLRSCAPPDPSSGVSRPTSRSAADARHAAAAGRDSLQSSSAGLAEPKASAKPPGPPPIETDGAPDGDPTSVSNTRSTTSPCSTPGRQPHASPSAGPPPPVAIDALTESVDDAASLGPTPTHHSLQRPRLTEALRPTISPTPSLEPDDRHGDVPAHAQLPQRASLQSLGSQEEVFHATCSLRGFLFWVPGDLP